MIINIIDHLFFVMHTAEVYTIHQMFFVKLRDSKVERRSLAFQVSSVLYLDSPAGVGLSYSANQSDYKTGDLKTATDSHTFLLKVR